MSKLREARIARELTQQEVANRAGIRPNWYNMIENGQRTAPAHIAERIAQALGTDVTSLFECASFSVRR